MGKIGKSISRLLTFAAFGAWFTFTIWGLKTWGTTEAFVSEKTTVILLSLLTFIGMFILFVIASALGAIGKKKKEKKEEEKKEEEKKEEEKKFSFTTKDGDKMEFGGGEDFDLDKIPAPFKEIGKKFMEMAKKEMNKEK